MKLTNTSDRIRIMTLQERGKLSNFLSRRILQLSDSILKPRAIHIDEVNIHLQEDVFHIEYTYTYTPDKQKISQVITAIKNFEAAMRHVENSIPACTVAHPVSGKKGDLERCYLEFKSAYFAQPVRV